jgi:hypothetical protein
MSSNEPTSTSPIGDPVSLKGIYKGYDVYITFAGAIVARSTDIEVLVNNNLEEIYECGNRHPLIVPGNFSCGGSLTGYSFDTAKFSMAVGMERDRVDPQADIVIGESTFPDEMSSPEFGEQPYFAPPRFQITCELNIPNLNKYIMYRIDGAVINNWRLTATQPGDVKETTTFLGASIHKIIGSNAAT